MLKAPLFFEKNRVFRVYTGGALFADFFGDDSTDGNLPEEWVVFSVAALNRVSRGEKDGVRTEELISYEDTPCFAVHRYTVTDSALMLCHKPCVYVVTAGEGTVECMGEIKALKKGEYFFLPYGAEETVVKTAGSLEIVACLPPKAEK